MEFSVVMRAHPRALLFLSGKVQDELRASTVYDLRAGLLRAVIVFFAWVVIGEPFALCLITDLLVFGLEPRSRLPLIAGHPD
jgi:hypothetical protein